MLKAPGESPRHLPPLPSPSPRRSTDGAARASMEPPAPKLGKGGRKREVEVLDEDEYVAAIEHIVQRDYFPDLPRLHDRLEWLEAIRTGDPEVIRAATLRIMHRRAQRGQGRAAATPSSAGTPRSSLGTPGSVLPSPSPSLVGGLRSPWVGPKGEGGEEEEEEGGRRARLNMSLDDFLQTHTSEDNASFNALKEKENKRRREKAAELYLLEDGSASGTPRGDGAEGTIKLLEGSKEDRKIDGYGGTGQPTSTLQLWPYKAKNALMYDTSARDAAPFTAKELEERAMGPPKEVKYANTRFRHAPAGASSDKVEAVEDKVAILYAPLPGATPLPYVDSTGERGSRKHYDLDDLRRGPQAGKDAAEGGVASLDADGRPTTYEYVATPSFTPGMGVDASPLMTWGDIDGTPLRLESEDTPVGIGGGADGPHFQIPAAPIRDEAAMTMSRAAAKSLRERKRQKTGPGTPLAGLSSAASLGGASPALSAGGMSPAWSKGPKGLSDAAMKFLKSATKGKEGRYDANLRASYAASPMRSPAAPGSAVKNLGSTPKGSRLAAPSPAPSTGLARSGRA